MNLFKSRLPEPEIEAEIKGERALSSVNKGITLQHRITNGVVILFAVGLMAILLYKYYASMYHDYKQAHDAPKDSTRTVTTKTLPPLELPDAAPATTSAAAVADKLPPMAHDANPALSGPAAQPSAKSPVELVQERRLKREVRFSLDGGGTGAAAAGADAAPATGTGTGKAGGAPFSPSRAFMLPDPSLMMTRGRVIPCTPLPAIDTTLKGLVTCVTAEDAMSADNTVSLMDRGTFCVGLQGGGVMHGQRRVGVIWQRCETPQHVLVPLEGDTTDALGRPGIPGVVDNHFWDRFGAAIALSLISDIGPYLIATHQGGGNNNTTIAFPNIASGPTELMTEVLKSTVDIPPTITAPQAARVLIFLNADLDFRDVYQLERTK